MGRHDADFGCYRQSFIDEDALNAEDRYGSQKVVGTFLPPEHARTYDTTEDGKIIIPNWLLAAIEDRCANNEVEMNIKSWITGHPPTPLPPRPTGIPFIGVRRSHIWEKVRREKLEVAFKGIPIFIDRLEDSVEDLRRCLRESRTYTTALESQVQHLATKKTVPADRSMVAELIRRQNQLVKENGHMQRNIIALDHRNMVADLRRQAAERKTPEDLEEVQRQRAEIAEREAMVDAKLAKFERLEALQDRFIKTAERLETTLKTHPTINLEPFTTTLTAISVVVAAEMRERDYEMRRLELAANKAATTREDKSQTEVRKADYSKELKKELSCRMLSSIHSAELARREAEGRLKAYMGPVIYDPSQEDNGQYIYRAQDFRQQLDIEVQREMKNKIKKLPRYREEHIRYEAYHIAMVATAELPRPACNYAVLMNKPRNEDSDERWWLPKEMGVKIANFVWEHKLHNDKKSSFYGCVGNRNPRYQRMSFGHPNNITEYEGGYFRSLEDTWTLLQGGKPREDPEDTGSVAIGSWAFELSDHED